MVLGIKQLNEKVNQKDGYYETDNYIVTFAFGHLLELFDFADYGITGKWHELTNSLPFVPKFQYTIKRVYSKTVKRKVTDTGAKKQLAIIKSLIARTDVDGVINCGDADREGEIIIRNILDYVKNTKPVYRIWLVDQTENTIVKELNSLKPSSNYDNLANEGYARTYLDWLIGINLTVYATNKSGTLFKLGRVVSAIVSAIVERDNAIKNFISEKYYKVESICKFKDGSIKLICKEKFDKNSKGQAVEKTELLNEYQAVVEDKQQKDKVINSPKLFSLSTLQNFISKKYKLAPNDILDVVQSLYDKKLVSYPRTNTEYLATAEKDKVKSIIASLNCEEIEFKDTKRVFDDAKIVSHSALTPTTKKCDSTTLVGNEKVVYDAILNRFKQVFYKEPCIDSEIQYLISVDEDYFQLKGSTNIQKGWRNLSDTIVNDKILPNLELNQKFDVKFEVVEKDTEPPKHYTVETLNNFLKNPFKDKKSLTEEEEYKDLFDGIEIGTDATRSGIIKKAIENKYIELNKDVYKSLPLGQDLVQVLDKLNIDLSKESTVDMSKQLKAVFRNELSISEVVKITEDYLRNIINQDVEINHCKRLDAIYNSNFICPYCKKPLRSNAKGLFCDNEECNFYLMTTICNKKITNTMALELLEKGKTSLIKGFTSKNGKPFNAKLKLSDEKKVEFEF